jgi:hypothetical protein
MVGSQYSIHATLNASTHNPKIGIDSDILNNQVRHHFGEKAAVTRLNTRHL